MARKPKTWKIIFYMSQLALALIVLNHFDRRFPGNGLKLFQQLRAGFSSNIVFSRWYYHYVVPNEDGGEMRIPLIIHFSVPYVANVSTETATTMDHMIDEWKKHHPDWQFMFWTDETVEEFMNANYNDYYEGVLSRFDNRGWKYIACTYFILYHFGGVYTNMWAERSIEPIHNIEPLLMDTDNVLVEISCLGLTNQFIASKKTSQLMRFIMEHLDEYIDEWPYDVYPIFLSYFGTVGTAMLQSATARYSMNGNESISIIDDNIFNKPMPNSDCVMNSAVAYFNHAIYDAKRQFGTFQIILPCYYRRHGFVITGGTLLLCKITHHLYFL